MGVCEHVDCEREAVGATGACKSHGGLQQCYLCDKWAIRGGKCKRHAIIGGLFERADHYNRSSPKSTTFA